MGFDNFTMSDLKMKFLLVLSHKTVSLKNKPAPHTDMCSHTIKKRSLILWKILKTNGKAEAPFSSKISRYTSQQSEHGNFLVSKIL